MGRGNAGNNSTWSEVALQKIFSGDTLAVKSISELELSFGLALSRKVSWRSDSLVTWCETSKCYLLGFWTFF